MSIFTWRITCANKSECGKVTPLLEIADLVGPAKGYLDKQGWFLCSWCGGRGYIVDFNPVGDDFSDDNPHKLLRSHLLGIIPTSGYEESENRPIAFLVSLDPDDPPPACMVFQPTRRPPPGKPRDVGAGLHGQGCTEFTDADGQDRLSRSKQGD